MHIFFVVHICHVSGSGAILSCFPLSGLNIMRISSSITLCEHMRECESVFPQCLSWESGLYRRFWRFSWKCVKEAFYWCAARSWKRSDTERADLRLQKPTMLKTSGSLWARSPWLTGAPGYRASLVCVFPSYWSFGSNAGVGWSVLFNTKT